MKNAFVFVFSLQILIGCVVNPKSKETVQALEIHEGPRPSARLHGRTTGNPVVIYYEIYGWTECASPSITYEHNLEHKADMTPLQGIKIPKWGLPFEFDAFYYYETMDDGYMKYYIVTRADAISKTSQSKCFDLVFDKPNDEKICDPDKITQNLKKWFLPNHVTFKEPQKITKAAQQLPMILEGCFGGKNLDIIISLKEAIAK